MGTCHYCRQDAGRLRRRHPDCHRAYRDALRAVPQAVAERIAFGADTGLLWREVQIIASVGFLPREVMEALIAQGWDQALDAFLYADGTLAPSQAQRLQDAARDLQIKPTHLQQRDIPQKVAEAQARASAPARRTQLLQQIRQGDLPDFPPAGPPPCPVSEGERLVWVFEDVTFYEEETRSRQAAHGPRTALEARDVGALSFTTARLVFGGSHEGRTTPFFDVLRLEPFEGALGVTPEGAGARRQLFTGLDGELAYALALRLAGRP